MKPCKIKFKSYIGDLVLKEKQKALGLPSHELIMDCKTRWNSAYDMVERYVEQLPAIIATFMDERVKKNCEARPLQMMMLAWLKNS